MKQSVHVYHFGRLNLLGATYEGKRGYILEALRANIFESDREFKYLIAKVQELTVNDDVFVYGTLVKYKELLEGIVVDENRKELVEGGLPDGLIAEAKFFLHYGSSVVAYRPIANRISDRQFRNLFARLIQAGRNNLMVTADVESIDEEIQILEALEELVTIERITIDLHPTNPSNREIYISIDERLKRLRAERMRQTIEAKDGGLNKTAIREDDTYRGIVMATDGYGWARVDGVNKEGRQVQINTDDSPITARVTDFENPHLILESLLSTFTRIWARMQK